MQPLFPPFAATIYIIYSHFSHHLQPLFLSFTATIPIICSHYFYHLQPLFLSFAATFSIIYSHYSYHLQPLFLSFPATMRITCALELVRSTRAARKGFAFVIMIKVIIANIINRHHHQYFEGGFHKALWSSRP